MRHNIHQYYVYMLTNRWRNVLYTGVTNSLERRVWQHKHGKIAGFTKTYNCDRLVYHELYERIDQAIAREKQIKGWIRVRKNALVESMNPEWNDLAADWYPTDLRIDEGGPSPSSRLRMTATLTTEISEPVILSREDGEGPPDSRAGKRKP